MIFIRHLCGRLIWPCQSYQQRNQVGRYSWKLVHYLGPLHADLLSKYIISYLHFYYTAIIRWCVYLKHFLLAEKHPVQWTPLLMTSCRRKVPVHRQPCYWPSLPRIVRFPQQKLICIRILQIDWLHSIIHIISPPSTLSIYSMEQESYQAKTKANQR